MVVLFGSILPQALCFILETIRLTEPAAVSLVRTSTRSYSILSLIRSPVTGRCGTQARLKLPKTRDVSLNSPVYNSYGFGSCGPTCRIMQLGVCRHLTCKFPSGANPFRHLSY